jgi:Carboxypeptidase regulatory-like domain/Photosynthesis system II assembly factor YCF48
MDRMTKLVAGRLRAQASAGPHPDPEVLSAFAENALSDGERGPVLQHLGACSDCREVLYLASPVSPEMQEVLVPQPRPFAFRRWIFGWGALAASLVVAAIVFTTNRLEYRNQSAKMLAPAPAAVPGPTAPTEPAANSPAAANQNETKIAADKTPQELNRLQAARDAMRRDSSKSKMAVDLEKSESTPQPEAKHMTAKPQANLDFDESGQVRVSGPKNPAPESSIAASRAGSRENLPLQGRNMGALVAAPAPPQAIGGTAGGAIGYAYSRPDQAKKSPVVSNLGGTVLDPSGAVIANARITAVGPSGESSATSDAIGRFSFDPLSPGSYTVKVEAAGFKATEIKQVAVLGDKPAALDVRLEVGTSSEVVEVTGAASVVAETRAGSMDAAGASSGYLAQRQQAAQDFSGVRPNGPNARPLKDAKVTSGSGVSALRWTLSPEGVVQHSGDGGKTWQPASVGASLTFRALSAVGQDIWVGGKAGALYHSADSGQSWVKCAPAAGNKKLGQDIVRVDFSDSLNGTVNTANGEVWTTSDGGQTWLLK